uniref:Uncharacterized protein n=1 Tax=Cannabis sativa TaxID=3483 RepID=A0A803PJC3_CANSA
MAEDTPQNEDTQPGETTQRPRKEHSHKTNATETPRSRRENGEGGFEQTGGEIPERQSNRRNAELEHEAIAARVARNDAPPSQQNTSTRQPQGRPRGSRTKRHGENPRGDNHENPTNPRVINQGIQGIYQWTKEVPKIQEITTIGKLDPTIKEPPVVTRIMGLCNLTA